MKTEKTRIVPGYTVPERTQSYDEYHCDRCGKEICDEDPGDDHRHYLFVSLDQYECVSYVRDRDYCPGCMTLVWDAISLLIKADPQLEREDLG
jgi:hypothetical protein